MNLKKYAYEMWVLSQEDQRRGNPSGVEMGIDLFRKGCLTGTEPLEGFDSGAGPPGSAPTCHTHTSSDS